MKAVETGNAQIAAILLQRQCSVNIQEYVSYIYYTFMTLYNQVEYYRTGFYCEV